MRSRQLAVLTLLLGLAMSRNVLARDTIVTGYHLLVNSAPEGRPPTANQWRPTPGLAPRFNLKNGTLSLFDPFAPSFNIAAEHIIRPRLYGQLEAGPLFNLRVFREPAIENLKGYRMRGAIRYYLRPNEIGNYAPFIELMYARQYTDVDIEGDFFRRDNTVGSYRQRITYHMEQHKQGGYINLGIQQAYARRFIFEFGAGLGVSRKQAVFSGVPPDASFRTNGALGWEYTRSSTNANTAAVQFYINLGYVLT